MMSRITARIRKSKIGQRIIKMNLGRYKAWYQRVALYVTGLNFLMIFYNFTEANEWLSWYGWLFVFVLFISSILFIDIAFIWESEQDTAARKNPILMEIKEKVDYLYNKKKEIESEKK